MKKKQCVCRMLVAALVCLCVFSCVAQENEMPITSKSKEAIKIFKEARTMSENFEYGEDINKYNKALELDPDFALAYLYKAINAGNYNERMKNLNEAISRIDQVTEGEKTLILMHKARFNSNEKEMWDYLDKLYQLYPQDKRVNILVATLNYNWQKYDEALKYYHIALKIDKNYPAAINMLGYTYRALEDYEKAESYYKQYIELLPNNAGPYDSYADFLLSKERYDESIKYYQKAVEKDPAYFYSLRRIGNIYILKEDYEKAREAFQKYYDASNNLGPKFGALYSIASSYLYEGNKEMALNTFEKYKTLAQENKVAYNEVLVNAYQGYIYACCENPQKGLEYYDKAIQIMESSDLNEEKKYELKVNAAIWKSHALIELNDFNKSKAELDKCKKLAAKLDNTYINAWVDIMFAYQEINQDNTQKGIEILNNITVNHPLKNYYLGLAYEKEGDMDNAKKYYSEILNAKESGMNMAMYYKRVKEKME